MGWGRTLLLGDWGTQMNVGDVERDVEQIKALLQAEQFQHHSVETSIAALRKENRELKVYLVTLIRLLRAKNVLTDEELNRFVNVIEPAEANP